jgi:hypothetical protein
MEITKLFEKLSAPTPEAENNLKPLILCDVHKTLLTPGFALNTPLHDFLLWCRVEKGYEVVLITSEKKGVQKQLQDRGCNDDLRKTLEERWDLHGRLKQQGRKPMLVIDDESNTITGEMNIHPTKDADFVDFLATSQYRNPGRSHPEDPPRRPGP